MNARHAWQPLLLALLLASVTAPAVAASRNDGGGRSIFADGAGIRALSLGGAYAAVADDASGALWNPAGLGFARHYELQASHTDLIGFGFSEHYASFVLPSWRLGTFALTYRHFGVDGIEERDNRNVLVSDDLGNRETELAFAYGYALGGAWSLGGCFKIRSHKLASTSDVGYGLDLGVLVRPLVAVGSGANWANDLRLGLAVRNAVEPVLRLVDDAVPDPTGLRGGVAFGRQVGAQGSYLLSLDLEKTRDMDSHLHVGVEGSFTPLMVLRLGLNDGTLVAGTTLRWQTFGVEYVFEDLAPRDIHRIGLSLLFGPSRAERQQAALTLREDALHHRFDSALERETQRRATELAHKCRTAMGRDDLEGADVALAKLTIIDPDHPQLNRLVVVLRHEQARESERAGNYTAAIGALSQALRLDPADPTTAAILARVRGASDDQAARSAATRARLDRALAELAVGDLLAARAGYRAILSDQPDDEEAHTMLWHTDETIGRRTDDLATQARTLTAAGQLVEAEAALDEARRLDAENRNVGAVADYLASAKLADAIHNPAGQATPAGVESGADVARSGPQGQTIIAKRQQEIADLYRRGIAALERGHAAEAVHFWEIVWGIDPNYQQVSDHLKRQYLCFALEAFLDGQVELAVDHWQQAVRVDPADLATRGYVERANLQLDRQARMP